VSFAWRDGTVRTVNGFLGSAMSSDILRDSLRRFLDRRWSIRESAQEVRSASVMQPLWRELCELGFSQLGAQETGGLSESLPILQDLGSARLGAALAGAG
jgi:alkylation response protein AidB-like acyl-CoA dehydrogenase